MTSSFGQPVQAFSQPKNVNPGITKKEEDQQYSASEGTEEGGSAGDGSSGNSYEPGLFNFGQIMDNFYSREVAEDDTLGQLQKSAFEGNMVQTAFDAQIASGLAEQNAALAQENMAQQADLEKLNSLDLMQAEFGYNELSKESNFNYENSFANAQYDRDVGMLAATGEQQRDNIKEQSNQDRLTNIVQGEQQRLTDAQNIASQEKIATGQYASDDYRAEVAADASKFGAQTSADASRDVAETQAGASNYGADRQLDAAERQAQASENVATTQAGADTTVATTQACAQTDVADTQRASALETTGLRTEADKDVAETAAGASIYGSKRTSEASEDVARTQAGASMYGADQSRLSSFRASEASEYGADRQLEGVKDTNVTSTRNIRATGDETRSTQDNEQRLKARERADMSRYSRSMARAN